MKEMADMLRPDERIDDLVASGLRIIQSEQVFSFSLDAVLLARFAGVPPRGRLLDLCAGNGVVPILLTTRTAASIDAVEIQPRLADMARRSVNLNGLGERIRVIEADLREYTVAGPGYDAITVNPPYLPLQAGEPKSNAYQAMARHEVGCTLADVTEACGRLVKPGGKVSMVHRPQRLAEIIVALREARLEPKRMRFVHPRLRSEANMVLIEAVRGGRPEVRLLPPLIVYESDGGAYTQELLDVFYGRANKLADGPEEERRNG